MEDNDKSDANKSSSLQVPENPVHRRLSQLREPRLADIESLHSDLSKEEQALRDTSVGERLKYNDYTTIDWLHDLVKESYRFRAIHGRKGLRNKFLSYFDSCQGWLVAAMSGTLTAIVAFIVDIGVATVSDWKFGYCKRNIFSTRETCCTEKDRLILFSPDLAPDCQQWHSWSEGYWQGFGIYIGFALLFGIISGSLTMTTRANLPAAAVKPIKGRKSGKQPPEQAEEKTPQGKTMYMAAGSGIPEIKTILSGFVIPHFLSFKVLMVKSVGSIFAVPTGMCLGKEGPLVHSSACVGYLVATIFPKYRNNSRKLREILGACTGAGLAVAFGAPLGGVLFAYEEISSFFPRKVLWRAFVCSLFSAVVLRALNPMGTGKLTLFETRFGTSYSPEHYLVFIGLGLAGGLFGGFFCKANFAWSRWFRKFAIISQHPVFETALIVLVTTLVQYPNPITREPGDVIIKNLLVDCRDDSGKFSWVCTNEAEDDRGKYVGWLIYGTLVKLVLLIVTFGVKVPSGVIIPALDGGAFFGRLVGQVIPGISPGIFAMVGAGAFLAGVSRMTISFVVIMFELTGEIEYVVPNMIAIMIAKWVADAIEPEGVYDLAQTMLGHPFLDLDQSLKLTQQFPMTMTDLLPPAQTMDEITVIVPESGLVPRTLLAEKLELLHRRGLMDAGLVLVNGKSMLIGYIAEGELEHGLHSLTSEDDVSLVRMHPPIVFASDLAKGSFQEPQVDDRAIYLGSEEQSSSEEEIANELDLSAFVDRTPLTIFSGAPVEYCVEMFGKLGLRQLCVLEEGSGKLVGVVIKKRLIDWLEGLKHKSEHGS